MLAGCEEAAAPVAVGALGGLHLASAARALTSRRKILVARPAGEEESLPSASHAFASIVGWPEADPFGGERGSEAPM
jgi:hypothetical protein